MCLLIRGLNVSSLKREVVKRDSVIAVDCGVFFFRDIAKNSLLQWPIFIYWTVLGVYDAIVMFFGAYFLFDNTTFTSNGQVTANASVCPALCFINDHESRINSATVSPYIKEGGVALMVDLSITNI